MNFAVAARRELPATNVQRVQPLKALQQQAEKRGLGEAWFWSHQSSGLGRGFFRGAQQRILTEIGTGATLVRPFLPQNNDLIRWGKSNTRAGRRTQKGRSDQSRPSCFGGPFFDSTFTHINTSDDITSIVIAARYSFLTSLPLRIDTKLLFPSSVSIHSLSLDPPTPPQSSPSILPLHFPLEFSFCGIIFETRHTRPRCHEQTFPPRFGYRLPSGMSR